MKALVIHGAKDLRLETRDAEAPGPGQVAVALKTVRLMERHTPI
jgi:L-idonate 5-dehydrogenase